MNKSHKEIVFVSASFVRDAFTPYRKSTLAAADIVLSNYAKQVFVSVHRSCFQVWSKTSRMLSKLSRFVKPSLGRQFAALSTAPQPQPNPSPDIKHTGVIFKLLSVRNQKGVFQRIYPTCRFLSIMNGKRLPLVKPFLPLTLLLKKSLLTSKKVTRLMLIELSKPQPMHSN